MYKYLILILVVVAWSFKIRYISGSESCWNNKNECNIKTELFQNLEFLNGISMQIDCRDNLDKVNENKLKEDKQNDYQTLAKDLSLRRLLGIQSVMLDGCQTPLNSHTCGLEFLPECANITKASIRHFHMDTLIPINCGKNSEKENNIEQQKQQLQLEYINVQYNEIAAIDADTFTNNCPHLKDIRIERNFLKVIHEDAFRSLRSLESVHIVNESVLMLKFPDLFKYTSVLIIHLEALKQMTSEIFRRLPETLQNLYVADTQFDNDDVVVHNSLALKNLTIKNCDLRKFTLHDNHLTVKRINLSGNKITTFAAYKNNLKELNLSNNKLKWFPFEWSTNLSNLETLILNKNQIEVLSLSNLFQAMPKIHIVDISGNRLQYLQDYDKRFPDGLLSQVRLKCDQNSWNCLWLLEFAHQHPEKFRVLQYEKFISKINVNGLECIPAENQPASDGAYLQKMTTNNLPPNPAVPEQITNVSAYTPVYGNPWEFKRNQRAEALIIVFMLPLGIALLFLLLYMWIYCQKMFHLSFYQDFSCMRRSTLSNTQRFDVVRQLSPSSIQTNQRQFLNHIHKDNNESYEVPINDIISECNCILQRDDEIKNCNKTIYATTHEQLPTEELYQIYEEIIHVKNSDRTNPLHEEGNIISNK